jgi:hypothetical protein
MNRQRWIWAGAKSTGTSHLRVGSGCDDFGSCVEISGKADDVLAVVASDGAGSARYSAVGSWITTRVFVKNAAHFVRSGSQLRELSSELVGEWVDEVRDRIASTAAKRDAKPRDFAATIVGALVGNETSVFYHIGDGAAVYRTTEEEKWVVASWPAQGEYAGTTNFVTDDPEPKSRLVVVDQEVAEVAVLTDGIERLVLNFADHSPHAPFFNKMLKPLAGTIGGRNRKLSRDLQSFLDSPIVCDKTDDDKTLIFARRAR